MTNGEKLIWAAAYAAELSRQYERSQQDGRFKMDIPSCVEHGWAAVQEARESVPRVEEWWGTDEDVTLMLKEMLQP